MVQLEGKTFLIESIGTTVIQVATGEEDLIQSIVALTADANNTGIVYVGFESDVSNGIDTSKTGLPIYPGKTQYLFVNNLDKLWIIGSLGGQKLFVGAQ